MEESNYYPFGLKHKGYNNVITGRDHKYGFGGKEYNDELGLDWYDHGARNYMADIGRWGNLDPHADTYVGLTPYSYAANNPALLNDPDGRDIGFSWETDKNGNITGINITVTGKIKDDTSKGMSAKKLEKLRKRLVKGITSSIKSDDKNFNVNVTANIGTAQKESDFTSTDHAYRIVDNVDVAVGNPKKANTRALGQAGIGDNYVYLDKNFDSKTVAHETVHSAGLPHINAEKKNGKFGKATDVLGKTSKGVTLYKRYDNNYHKQNLMHQGGALNKHGVQVGGEKLRRWQFNKMLNSVKSINSGKQKI